MVAAVSPPSLRGLTRQSIFFAKCSCEADGPPNSGSPEFGFLSCASRINPTGVVKPAGDGREWVSAEPIRTGTALVSRFRRSYPPGRIQRHTAGWSMPGRIMRPPPPNSSELGDWGRQVEYPMLRYHWMLRTVSVAWPEFAPSRPTRLGRTDEFDRWWEHHTSVSDRSLVFEHQAIPCGDQQPSRRIARILW